MATSDLLYLIAVISGGVGTFCLGIIAWLNIRQTKNIQKAERRERLLNEIIEWALEVSSCSSISTATKYAEIKDIIEHRIMVHSDLMGRYVSLEKQGEYIKQIAFRLDQGLNNAVEEVITNMRERELLLAASIANPPLDLEEMQKVTDILSGKNVEIFETLSDEAKKEVTLGKNAGKLNESISKVIEEAAKIKTKDIG